MCKHKPKRLQEFEPILKANGYHEIRSRGSHFIYGNGKNQITVNKDLNKMVQLRLIKENNLLEVRQYVAAYRICRWQQFIYQ